MVDPGTEPSINFNIAPTSHRHWDLTIDGPVATLEMRVDPAAGIRDDYELKTNSYDLGVDIELHDLMQRLMVGVTKPGKMAGWVAAPSRGIQQRPVDYDYVRL